MIIYIKLTQLTVVEESEVRQRETKTVIDSLYLYQYINVCLFVRVFLGHSESDWDTLWHKVAFRPRMSSKKNKSKSYFSQSYCPLSIFL